MEWSSRKSPRCPHNKTKTPAKTTTDAFASNNSFLFDGTTIISCSSRYATLPALPPTDTVKHMSGDVDVSDYLARELADHAEVANRTARAVDEVFPRVVEVCLAAVRDGHKLLFFGNGGSAAD